jgi:hypothetical protein
MSSSSKRESSSSKRESSSVSSASKRESSSQHTIEVKPLERRSTLPKIDVKEIKQKKSYRYNFLKLIKLYQVLNNILLEIKEKTKNEQSKFEKMMDELEEKKFLKKKEIEDLTLEDDELQIKMDKDLTEEEKIKLRNFEQKLRVVIKEKDDISDEILKLHRSKERHDAILLHNYISESSYCIKKLLKIFESEELFYTVSAEEIEELLQDFQNNINNYLKNTKNSKDTTELELKKLINLINEQNRINQLRDKSLQTKKPFEIKSYEELEYKYPLTKIKRDNARDSNPEYKMEAVDKIYSDKDKANKINGGISGGNNTSSKKNKKKYKNKKKTIKRGKLYKKYNKISSKRQIYKKRL